MGLLRHRPDCGRQRLSEKAIGKIEGTWEIVGDEFCRVWKEVSGGKRVCERWIIVGENKVEVRKKKNGKYTKAGINSW